MFSEMYWISAKHQSFVDIFDYSNEPSFLQYSLYVHMWTSFQIPL